MKGIFEGSPNIVTPVMEERIIKVAYQNGSWLDKVIVNHVRKENPKVEKLLQHHLQAVTDVRITANEVVCPDNLEARLMNVAETGEQTKPWYSGVKRGFFALQATTAFAAIILSVMLVHQFRGPSAEQQEIEAATLQAKASLALISEIMNGTRDTVRDEVILQQTVKPIHDSIYKGTETIKRNI